MAPNPMETPLDRLRRRVSRYNADVPIIVLMEDGLDGTQNFVPVTPPRYSSLPSPADFPSLTPGADDIDCTASSAPRDESHLESDDSDSQSGDSHSTSQCRSFVDSDDGASDSDASMSTAPTSAMSECGSAKEEEELMSAAERVEFGPVRNGLHLAVPTVEFGRSVLDFGTILCHPPLVAPSSKLPSFAEVFPSFTPRTFRSMSCLKTTTRSYPVPRKVHSIPRKPVPSSDDLPLATRPNEEQENVPTRATDMVEPEDALPRVLVIPEEPAVKRFSLQVHRLEVSGGTSGPIQQVDLLGVKPSNSRRRSWYGGDPILRLARIGAR